MFPFPHLSPPWSRLLNSNGLRFCVLGVCVMRIRMNLLSPCNSHHLGFKDRSLKVPEHLVSRKCKSLVPRNPGHTWGCAVTSIHPLNKAWGVYSPRHSVPRWNLSLFHTFTFFLRLHISMALPLLQVYAGLVEPHCLYCSLKRLLRNVTIKTLGCDTGNGREPAWRVCRHA